jgi:hypothetical protein
VKAGGDLTQATSTMDAQLADLEANTDPLIRLPNRRALDRHLPSLMRRAVDDEQPLCVEMVNFDHFSKSSTTCTAMPSGTWCCSRWRRSCAPRPGLPGFGLTAGRVVALRRVQDLLAERHQRDWDRQSVMQCVEGQGIHRRACTEEDWPPIRATSPPRRALVSGRLDPQ